MSIKSFLLNFLRKPDRNLNIRLLLVDFIKKAEKLGLPPQDIATAQEFLDYNESELCFDTIVIQLYEHEIKIDVIFYTLAQQIASKMKLQEDAYSYLKELI